MKLRMTRVFVMPLAFILSSAASTPLAALLPPLTNEPIEASDVAGRYWVAPELSAKKAAQLRKFLIHENLYDEPAFYKIPGRAFDYLAVAYRKDPTDQDFGKSMHWLRASPQSVSRLAKVGGNSDAYDIRPNFFRVGELVLLLAESAAEESWGYHAYEIGPKGMRDLGPLDVTQPGDANSALAIRPVEVKTTKLGWRVSFDHEIYWSIYDPVSKKRSVTRMRPHQGKWIHFMHHGENFQPVPETFEVVDAPR